MSKKCVKLILIGETHEDEQTRENLVNLIGRLFKDKNCCFFYETPIDIPIGNVTLNALEPPVLLVEQQLIDGTYFLKQNFPSILSDILYSISSIDKYHSTRTQTQDEAQEFENRLLEVIFSMEPTLKLNRGFDRFLLYQLLTRFSKNPSIKTAELIRSVLIDLYTHYKTIFTSQAEIDTFKVVDEGFSLGKNPIPHLQSLRNEISINTLLQYIDTHECDIAIVIVGDEHVDDLIVKISNKSISSSIDICISGVIRLQDDTNTRLSKLKKILNSDSCGDGGCVISQPITIINKGTRVKLVGIKNENYKDKLGVVVGYNENDKRYSILIDGVVKPISVKEENLEPIKGGSNRTNKTNKTKRKRNVKRKFIKSRKYKTCK